MELIRKSFETTDGEIYTDVPYDTKTKNWIYGVTWEEIERVMMVAEKNYYNIINRDAAKIIINLEGEHHSLLENITDEQIKEELEIYIATYDSLDYYLW